MKLRTLLLVVLATSTPLAAAQMHGPNSRRSQRAPIGPKINVLLEKNIASALVDAKGSFRVIRKDNGANLSSGSIGKRFVMHALQHGLRWGEEYPDVYQVSIIPTSMETTISVNGIQYKGAISVYHARDNNITIVNEVPIEDYLKSTMAVAFENESLADEALAALAIIARTEAYSKALNRGVSARPWDVAARETGYYGCGISQSKADAAIGSTRYMVLESLQEKAPVQHLHLSASKADELAQKGMDAQKILKSTFPSAKIGATITPDEVSIR